MGSQTSDSQLEFHVLIRVMELFDSLRTEVEALRAEVEKLEARIAGPLQDLVSLSRNP
jgi:hypothetical protein